MADEEFKMWDRLLESHTQDELKFSFHCLLLGGDQIYADPIWDEIGYFQDNRLLGWNSTRAVANHKIKPQDKDVLKEQIEKFYEDLYIACWNKAAVNRVLSSIPSIMMWDDHDIIDGWGSQPEKLQDSDIFKLIYDVAKKYFELLQIRGRENVTLLSDDHYSMHCSFRNYEIIVLDNRSFRTNHQIMSDSQYKDIEQIKEKDLFVHTPTDHQDQKSSPIFSRCPCSPLRLQKRTERWLKWFFRNNFRSSLNDDGLDHWDHEHHKDEQKRLIEMMFGFGEKFDPKYIHVISGDVHSAGAGKIVHDPEGDRRVINQLISSLLFINQLVKLNRSRSILLPINIAELTTTTLGWIVLGWVDSPLRPSMKRTLGFSIRQKTWG